MHTSSFLHSCFQHFMTTWPHCRCTAAHYKPIYIINTSYQQHIASTSHYIAFHITSRADVTSHQIIHDIKSHNTHRITPRVTTHHIMHHITYRITSYHIPHHITLPHHVKPHTTSRKSDVASPVQTTHHNITSITHDILPPTTLSPRRSWRSQLNSRRGSKLPSGQRRRDGCHCAHQPVLKLSCK